MNPSPTESHRVHRELQVVLDNAGVGIATIVARRVVRCNPEFAKIFAYPRTQDLIGLSSQQLYPNEAEFNALGAAAYPTLAQGQSYRTRIQMRRADGSLFWCSLTGCLLEPNEPDQGSVWIVEDVNDLHVAMQSLESTLAEQELILQNALVGIVFLKNRIVSRCNRLFETMFGYGPGELQGTTSRSWYHNDEDWLEAGRQCYDPLMRGDTFRAEMRLARRDGSTIWCDVLAKAINPADMGQGSIWITLDITARREAEQALTRAHAELEQQVALRTDELRQTVESLHREIAERQQMEQQIRHLALHDALTGLPNRSLMESALTQALFDAKTQERQVAVLFLDLDRFKQVNDAFGHATGDQLLREVARRLRAAVLPQATVSRQGGDEFVIVLPGISSRTVVLQSVRHIVQALRPPVMLGTRETRVACSIGISLYPEDGHNPEVLLKHADMAMYQAKQAGRDCHQFFNARLDVELQERLALEHALHEALQQQGFEVHYQPQVHMGTGRITAAEALVRWHRPGLGWESPARFIPVIEDMGLIHVLGQWVLEQACAQAQAWNQAGLPPVRMAVNVSARQIDQPDFVQQVLKVLARTGLPAQQLEIELTESLMMEKLDKTALALEQLHAAGVSISIDDFGTGYSSLSYLSRLPLDKLKIDRSFVRDIDTRESDAILCRTIIAMASNLNLRVTAEGVETQEQLELLRHFGCDHYQGYVFSRPVPGPQLSRMLESQILAQPL